LEVSAKIREIIRSDLPKRKVTRGAAFAADFDGQPALEEDAAQVVDKPKIGKELERSQSYKTRQTKEGKKLPCRTHGLSRCFYAFPELRYDGFIPNKKVEKNMQQILMDNSELENEIEAIRNEIEERKPFE